MLPNVCGFWARHVRGRGDDRHVTLHRLSIVDACIPNFYNQEVYPVRMPEHFAIVDRVPELEIRKSIMPIPDRPGMGVELVEERVRPFLCAMCTA